MNFLEENNLLPASQYGLRMGVGTEGTLVNLSKNIFDNLDKSNETDEFFLDLSKAFYGTSHMTFLNSLS